jgi:hypothetical protein
MRYKIKVTDNSAITDTSNKEFDLMQVNNHTHIAINYYDDGTTRSLKFYVNGEYVHNSA